MSGLTDVRRFEDIYELFIGTNETVRYNYMSVRIKRVSFGRGFTVLARQGIMKEGQTKNGNDINLFFFVDVVSFFLR